MIHGKSSSAVWRGELNDLIYKIIHIRKDRVPAGGLLEKRLKFPGSFLKIAAAQGLRPKNRLIFI
jgi:hypothetical protein